MPGVSGAASRADVFGAGAVILVTATLAFGPDLVARFSAHPTAAVCEELLARYVELKERSVTEKLDGPTYAAALSEARELAGPSFAACRTQMTPGEVECSRRANHVDEFERCLR